MLGVMNKERLFSDYELSRPAGVLAKHFIQRWDIHAKQLPDGGYICVHEPLNVDHLFAHLRGELTLGTYLINSRGQARFIVFDADDEQGFSRLAQLTSKLTQENVPSYLETSRRGGHLWLFFRKPVSGEDARTFGLGLLVANQIEDVELFPKQARTESGPGSLIRIPFGVHRITGRRYGFITLDGKPLAPTIRQQIHAFSTPQTIPNEVVNAYLTNSSFKELSSPLQWFNEPADTISERIKSSTTVLEFISQYVDLKPTSYGAIGLCPFHDDHHPSFGIIDKDNYWHCFAGCGGGSIIDFWMKRQECDFTKAVRELARMLL